MSDVGANDAAVRVRAIGDDVEAFMRVLGLDFVEVEVEVDVDVDVDVDDAEVRLLFTAEEESGDGLVVVDLRQHGQVRRGLALREPLGYFSLLARF